MMPLYKTLQTALLLAAALLPNEASAQTASYTYAGTSCTSGRLLPWLQGVPLQALDAPRIGQTLRIQSEGSTSYPTGVRRRTLLITGTSNTSSGGVTLPFDISTLYPAGEPVCGILRTSAEVVVDMPITRQWDAMAVIELPIPNDPALLGTRFYQQVLSIELNTFGQPYRGLTLSRGGIGVIGR